MTPAVEENLGRITRLTCRVLETPMAAVSLLDENRQWFKAAQGVTLTNAPRHHSFAERLVSGGDVLVVPDIARDGRFSTSPLLTLVPGLRFYAGVPLYADKSRYVGVLCVMDRKTRQLGACEWHMLRDLGALAQHELEVVAVEQSRAALASELTSARRQARVDALTHLLNRQGVLAALSEELQRSQREGFSVGLIFVDMDNFKLINDSYGHDAGDTVIREVACRMAGGLRSYDHAGRYGGDEFLVVTSSITQETLAAMAERIRQRVGGAPVTHRGIEITVTVSCGTAWSGPVGPAPMQQLIRDADQALYRAKGAGRNRVASAGTSV